MLDKLPTDVSAVMTEAITLAMLLLPVALTMMLMGIRTMTEAGAAEGEADTLDDGLAVGEPGTLAAADLAGGALDEDTDAAALVVAVGVDVAVMLCVDVAVLLCVDVAVAVAVVVLLADGLGLGGSAMTYAAP